MEDHANLGDGTVLIDLMTALDIPPVAKFNKKPKKLRDRLNNISKVRENGCGMLDLQIYRYIDRELKLIYIYIYILMNNNH